MNRGERLAFLATLFHVAANVANEHTSLTEEFSAALDYEKRGDELAAAAFDGGRGQGSPTPSRAREEAHRPTPERPSAPWHPLLEALTARREARNIRVAVAASIILDFLVNNQDVTAPDATAFSLAKYLDQREVLCRHNPPSK